MTKNRTIVAIATYENKTNFRNKYIIKYIK